MKTRKLVLTALFIALSFVGANIKVMGSIAFDSMPGFLGTLMLGPVYGAIIGAAGHFLTALLSGFPMTIPVHMVIMVGMAITMAAFGFVYNKFSEKKYGTIIAIITAILINGPILLLMVTPLLLPVMGISGILVLLPTLTGVSAINVILGVVVYKAILSRLPDRQGV
jgi:uncharacterized membrane protein